MVSNVSDTAKYSVEVGLSKLRHMTFCLKQTFQLAVYSLHWKLSWIIKCCKGRI